MRFQSILCGALASASFLAPAQLGAADTLFGGQVSFGRGSDDLETLTDTRNTWSLGAQALIDFGQGHGLRPRLDFARIKGTASETYPGGIILNMASTLDQYSLGADYLYHFSQNVHAGPYIMGGLGAVATRWHADLSVPKQPVSAEISATKVSPYVQAGLGWQFNRNFGIELRHQFSTFDPNVDIFFNAGNQKGRLEVQMARRNLGVTYLTANVRF